jgi:hypothetical protein
VTEEMAEMSALERSPARQIPRGRTADAKLDVHLRSLKLLVAALALATLSLALPAAASAGNGGVCFDCDEPDKPGPEADETPSPAPSQYTLRDLRRLARDVGFRKPKVAAAIAMAESSGDPKAVGLNRRPRSRDRGLFQINDRWHPEVSDRCAFDARCNAEAAHDISRGGRDWGQWSTWHNGAYKEFL